MEQKGDGGGDTACERVIVFRQHLIGYLFCFCLSSFIVAAARTHTDVLEFAAPWEIWLD